MTSESHSGRCPSCGLSPYESGIGDADISRIVAERNGLIEQLESARVQRDALAAECRQALGFITHMDMSYRFAEWIRGELNPAKRPIDE